jgi:hypothetical protein
MIFGISIPAAAALACIAVHASISVRAGDALIAQGMQPGDEKTAGARVAHYAVVITGATHGSSKHQKWYWGSNQRIYEMLRDVYGYPDECIYRLHEDGRAKDVLIDGRASLANVRKVFTHLAKVMHSGDQLFVYVVGHGGPRGRDYVYDLADGKLTASEFGRMLDKLSAQRIVVALNPCFSGGFIRQISGQGRVICTSTTEKEGNSAGWEGYMTAALARAEGADVDGNGRVSLKEAYNASVDGTKAWYHNKNMPLREHPLLDDNGDGIGHFGQAHVVGGDGKLAAETFLGNEGRKLEYGETALRALQAANTSLKLE